MKHFSAAFTQHQGHVHNTHTHMCRLSALIDGLTQHILLTPDTLILSD